MSRGCARDPDNVSLAESPPCGAAGSPLCATRGTEHAQILSPEAERSVWIVRYNVRWKNIHSDKQN